MTDIENLSYHYLDSVLKLQKTPRYIDVMQTIEIALEKVFEYSNQSLVLEDDPEYQSIADCNQLSLDIDNEIITIHNFIRDKYRSKFSELESIVHHPIDYARLVKRIGNQTDLTLVDLQGFLPSATIISVSLTASTTNGKPLPEKVLRMTLEACDCLLELNSSKEKVLDFVKSRMVYIAPNLSKIVGTSVAAKLMVTAGGLSALAKMPSCNVQTLGSNRKSLDGFSNATNNSRVGYLNETEIFKGTPPPLRTRACRLLAGKATLAARVDTTRGDPMGKVGKGLMEEIRMKIEKWQERSPARLIKPLPVPNWEPKKKRGGLRRRKMKERYDMTKMRKLTNRIQFGIPEDSSLGDGFGAGFGMLVQAGSGKLRISPAQNKFAPRVAKLCKQKRHGTSGFATLSLAFTPEQGMELPNPQESANQSGSRTQSTYFS